MNSIRTNILRLTTTLGIAAVMVITCIEPAKALDTDIYFSNPNSTVNTVNPNILLILDTSGSMNTTVSGTGKSRLNNMKDALNTILDNTNNVNMGLMRFSGDPGGPVLFPIADLDASAADIEGTNSATVQSSISASSDDAEEYKSTGAVNTTSATLDLINDGVDDQYVGLRFTNVNVPRGATITSAIIKFNVQDATPVGTTDLRIVGEASDNAATYTTTAGDISGRPITTAYADWNGVPIWPTVGEEQTSVDVKNIVEEIVKTQPGWCGGNAMAFKISSLATGQRIATSYDGDPSFAPKLIVTYDPTTIPVGSGCANVTIQSQVTASRDDAEERISGGGSNGNMDRNNNELYITKRGFRNQWVGMRFQNLLIPPGATIKSAEIEFTIRSPNSSTPTFAIYGHQIADSPEFSNNDFNISGRTKTTATVGWSSIPNPATNAKLITPDLKTIVQEIVGPPSGPSTGWASGNNMSFIFEGTVPDTRIVYSFDGEPSKAPVLRVTYQGNVSPTTPSNLTVRQRLKNIVSEMQASGSTPIVDTLYEAGLYFRGQPVLYGLKRGPQSGTIARYTRVSHPATYSGGSGVFRQIGCTDTDLNAFACEDEEIQGSPTYISPFTAGCQPNHIVLLTDGDPTVNNSVALVESLIGKACANTTDANQKCSNELAQYYSQTDLSTLADTQNIVLHTIGFNSDGDPDYLRDLAQAGGGSFKTATTASELTTVFEDIINQALKIPTSFVSPSLSVNAFNKLFNSDEVYFSLFVPDTTVSWPGNIKKFKLCADPAACTFGEIIDSAGNPAIDPTTSKITATSRSFWSSTADGPDVKKGGAGENIPGHGMRNIYTYTDTAVDVPASPVDLTAGPDNKIIQTTVGSPDNPKVDKVMLGDGSMTDQTYYDIINWMRGKNTEGEIIPTGTVVASGNRWAFADALHSRPVTIVYGYNPTSKIPVTKILTGTNDGALRMTNAETGVEQWAVYIPELLKEQDKLRDNANGQHSGGLDGSATVWTIDNNRNGIIEPGTPENDKVYLYIGERRGGRDVYAFDLTPASTLTDPTAANDINPKFLWRIKGGTGGFSNLGQTWSKPVLAKIRVKGATAGDSVLKDVLIFGGGYDPATQDDVMPVGADTWGHSIYIVDPLDSSLVWSAGNTGSGAALEIGAMNYSVAADVSPIDTDGDGAVDRLYAADTRGQIFRIDLGDQIDPAGATIADKNGGSSGYVFADVGCTGGTRATHCVTTAKENRRKFFYAPDVTQVTDPTFSSTSDYDLVTIESGDREDPLDKITTTLGVDPVHNRIYAFRDENIATGQAPDADTVTSGWQAPSPLADSDLYNATANILQDPADGAYPGELSNIKAAKGWFIDLKSSGSPTWIGEKGLAKTTVFGGVLFATTYTPATSTTTIDSCTTAAEGTGRLYSMNYLNGTAVNDLDGDGNIDRFISTGGGIPSEIVIVIREGGVTALVGTSGGATTPPINAKLPRKQTYWYDWCKGAQCDLN